MRTNARMITPAWARLPNWVVDDRRLGEAALVLLAYRATFVGAYALCVVVLLAQRLVLSGFGRDVIERAIRELVAAGYLDRQALPQGQGTYGKVREKLLLPPCAWERCWAASLPTCAPGEPPPATALNQTGAQHDRERHRGGFLAAAWACRLPS